MGNSSWASQLFGTIAGHSAIDLLSPNIGFVPIDRKGGTVKIRGGSARWLGLQNKSQQKFAYEFCYPLSSVVDRLAEYDLTGTVEVLRSTGKGKNNFATNEWAQRMNKLFDQPNPMQSWEQFRGQQVLYKKVFGFCPVLPIVPIGFDTQPWMAVTMVNLPPWLFEAIPMRGDITVATQKNEIVKEYRATILGRTITLRPDQVMILEDGFMQDEKTEFLLPQSKLVGLDMAVSNICAAMEADNVLLRKKGPLGFISHDAATKDQVSYTPMSKGHRRELQNSLSQYGLSWDQYQYVVSRVATRWNPMSFNVRDLATKETVEQGEKAICHRYAFPYVLYEETNTTYANGDNAAATVYQTNIVPNANKDINKYNKFFKAADNLCKIVRNFEEVGALQEDRKYAADADKAQNESLELQYNNDLITLNQWRERMGYDTQPGGDVLKSEIKGSDQPLAMKIGVGGVTSLISILSNTTMQPEEKRQALIVLFGLEPSVVNKMVAEKTDTAEEDAQDTIELDANGNPIPKLNIA